MGEQETTGEKRHAEENILPWKYTNRGDGWSPQRRVQKSLKAMKTPLAEPGPRVAPVRRMETPFMVHCCHAPVERRLACRGRVFSIRE